MQLFKSSSALLTLNLVNTRRTFLQSKAHAYSAKHLALRRTTFSLLASASFSSLRLVIVSRTKVKNSYRLLYIIYATSAIISKLSANKQT